MDTEDLIKTILSSTYEEFVDSLVDEIVRVSNCNGVLNHLLDSANGEIKEDILSGISRMRNNKINDILK